MENNSTNPSSRGSGVSLKKKILATLGILFFASAVGDLWKVARHEQTKPDPADIVPVSIEARLTETVSSTKAFRVDEYTTSIAKIGEAMRLFDQWAAVLAAASSATSTEGVKQRDVLTKEVQKIQADAFPKLRKAFSGLTAKKVWIEDMEVSIYGAKNERIIFVSASFAANRNVVEAHASLMDVLKQLRFKKVDYKWTSSASEWTSIDLETKQDQDI